MSNAENCWARLINSKFYLCDLEPEYVNDLNQKIVEPDHSYSTVFIINNEAALTPWHTPSSNQTLAQCNRSIAPRADKALKL